MNDASGAPIHVHVDLTNPGQFFACCGLLELADRYWGGAEGWFGADMFSLRPLEPESIDPSLDSLLDAVTSASLDQLDPDDDYASPMRVAAPFDLRLDWWKDVHAGGERLKVWAGSMRGLRIARAMRAALLAPGCRNHHLLDFGTVVYDPDDQSKKVEPFYFDARRGANASSIDIGFSPDTVKMTTLAYPAVEFLCMVGLQRFRPVPTDRRRVFEYSTWIVPLTPCTAPAALAGLLPGTGRAFRFTNAFRTDQKKHKAFTPATPISRS